MGRSASDTGRILAVVSALRRLGQARISKARRIYADYVEVSRAVLEVGVDSILVSGHRSKAW